MGNRERAALAKKTEKLFFPVYWQFNNNNFRPVLFERDLRKSKLTPREPDKQKNMSHEIGQWINEIKTLQQKLAEALKERDGANESISKWRQLYNTEAIQRRDEVRQAEETIAELKATIDGLQQHSLAIPEENEAVEVEQKIERIQSLDELRALAIETVRERDRALQEVQRLKEALEKERSDRQQTRKTLTAALGDAVELLTKAKTSPGAQAEFISQTRKLSQLAATGQLPASEQQPLPQLPEWKEKK
jgi:uncharacterized coiled-coil DUF342 family protein